MMENSVQGSSVRRPGWYRAILPLLLTAGCSDSPGAAPVGAPGKEPAVAETPTTPAELAIPYVGLTSEEVLETFHEDGKPKVRRQVKRDSEGVRNHGLYQQWSAGGQLLIEAHFADGLPHGRHAEWYEDGKPKAEGTYSQGVRDGRWTFWLQTGEQDPQSGVYEKGRRVSD